MSNWNPDWNVCFCEGLRMPPCRRDGQRHGDRLARGAIATRASWARQATRVRADDLSATDGWLFRDVETGRVKLCRPTAANRRASPLHILHGFRPFGVAPAPVQLVSDIFSTRVCSHQTLP